MKYLLDTDAIIHYLKGANQKIVDQIHTALESGSEMHISVITLAEYYHGAYASRNTEYEISLLQSFITSAGVLTLTLNDVIAEVYGKIQGALQKEGKIGSSFDMLIAATCIAYGYALITGNKKDFLRVKGLLLFDEKTNE